MTRVAEGRLGRVWSVVREQGAGSLAEWRVRVSVTLIGGVIFGAAMGSFDAVGPGRWLMPIYSGFKLPLLVLLTTAVCLPGHVVLSTVLRLRADLPASLGAIFAGQAAQAAGLVALAPVQLFAHVSGVNSTQAVLCAAGLFVPATLLGFEIMRRRYRPLMARSPRHRLMLAFWLGAYVFVGTQTGWMLRPFVGSPGLEVRFLRDEPFTNAYVQVAKIVASGLGPVRR